MKLNVKKSALYVGLTGILISLNISVANAQGKCTRNDEDPGKNLFNNLSAVMNSGRAEISWTCNDTENKIEQFVIEKSYNGKTFYAFSESNSSAQIKSYHEYYETDYKPGICYRIKCKTTNSVIYSEIKYLKKSELKVSELTGQTLVLLRDKSGNEFTSKINLTNKNGVLEGEDTQNKISAGDYLIVASANESLKFSRVLIVK